MARHVRLLANVGFPALYQFLFSYLLLLGNLDLVHSTRAVNIVIGTAIIGIPLIVAYNLTRLPLRCSNALLLIARPLLAAMALPFCQLALLFAIPLFKG